MVMGWPSPAAVSPLLVSRSTGPHPLLLETNGSAETCDSPAAGGAAVTVAAVADLVAVPPPAANVAEAASCTVPTGCGPDGRTVQSWVHAPVTLGVDTVGPPSTVHPSGTVSCAWTWVSAGEPSSCSVVVTTNGRSAAATSGAPSASVVNGGCAPPPG